jgi:hypothetical protein
VIVHLGWRGTATKTKAESHPHRAVDCRFVTGETRLGIRHIQFAGAVTSRKSPVAPGWGFEPPRGSRIRHPAWVPGAGRQPEQVVAGSPERAFQQAWAQPALVHPALAQPALACSAPDWAGPAEPPRTVRGLPSGSEW